MFGSDEGWRDRYVTPHTTHNKQHTTHGNVSTYRWCLDCVRALAPVWSEQSRTLLAPQGTFPPSLSGRTAHPQHSSQGRRIACLQSVMVTGVGSGGGVVGAVMIWLEEEERGGRGNKGGGGGKRIRAVCVWLCMCVCLCAGGRLREWRKKQERGPMTAGQDMIGGDELEREAWELPPVRSVRTRSMLCAS